MSVASNKDFVRGTQGWEQFHANRQEMLYQFELAKKYSKSHIVKVSHGNVAEATFRKWLSTFLPQRYGITSGYVVSQDRVMSGIKLPHYDVIIYDILDSPILWVEENSDHSEQGKTRAIPAEYVRAIFEVKANLTLESIKDANNKLLEIKPLLRTSTESSIYCGKLPSNFFTSSIFFELQNANAKNENIFRNLLFPEYNFPHFKSIILKGEGVDINSSGLVEHHYGEQETPLMFESMYGSPFFGDAQQPNGIYHGVMLTWMPANFARFAFDIVALLNGSFRPGFLSSFYGIDF